MTQNHVMKLTLINFLSISFNSSHQTKSINESSLTDPSFAQLIQHVIHVFILHLSIFIPMTNIDTSNMSKLNQLNQFVQRLLHR